MFLGSIDSVDARTQLQLESLARFTGETERGDSKFGKRSIVQLFLQSCMEILHLISSTYAGDQAAHLGREMGVGRETLVELCQVRFRMLAVLDRAIWKYGYLQETREKLNNVGA